MNEIRIEDFNYDLPEEKIPFFPLPERDASKLLLFNGNEISSDVFRNIDKYIAPGSLLVFNDTRVIKARLVFRKKSGARIEIFCLEPLSPAGYAEALSSYEPVEWKCIIGNLKKWKNEVLTMSFSARAENNILSAEKAGNEGEAWKIRFSWENRTLSFSEVIEAAGHIPLPPYISREDIIEDNERYQTVYSASKGSVAAPTAGLHFTGELLTGMAEKGIRKTNITLHVGAGTFQPVRGTYVSGHTMHTEHFFVSRETLSLLRKNAGRVVAVGTTSVRTIESLYWLGNKILRNKNSSLNDLTLSQWEPYGATDDIPVDEALAAMEELLDKMGWKTLEAATKIIIVPGYRFRLTDAVITNFHQPKSTLLLLVAAWTGPAWKEIYNYALSNGFRFLSYGDSSYLFKH